MEGDSSLHRGVLMLALEEQEGRRLLDVVWLRQRVCIVRVCGSGLGSNTH